MESVCSRNIEDNIRTQWSCHGRWTTPEDKQMLVLSTPIFNGLSSNFVCLSYKDKDGVLEAVASTKSCQLEDNVITASEQNSLENFGNFVWTRQFNISSSGPCTLPLTGQAVSLKVDTFGLSVIFGLTLFLTRL